MRARTIDGCIIGVTLQLWRFDTTLQQSRGYARWHYYVCVSVVRVCACGVWIVHHMLTGSMCRLYVCLTATLTIKSHARIAIPAMSQTSDGAYPVCPDCSSTGSSSELCHTTQLDLLLCTTCGRTYTVDSVRSYSEVSADE